MILSKGVNPSENLGCPSSPLIPSSSFSSPYLPFPSLLRVPWAAHHLNQLDGLGSAINSRSGVWD